MTDRSPGRSRRASRSRGPDPARHAVGLGRGGGGRGSLWWAGPRESSSAPSQWEAGDVPLAPDPSGAGGAGGAVGIPRRPRAPDSASCGNMDRMTSSMKQVPNPLPKVLSRRGVGAGMEAAERESFERTQVGTRGPRGMPGCGIPGEAVCRRALKGVGVLQAQ